VVSKTARVLAVLVVIVAVAFIAVLVTDTSLLTPPPR